MKLWIKNKKKKLKKNIQQKNIIHEGVIPKRID